MVERSFHVGYSTFSTAPFSHAYVNEKKAMTGNRPQDSSRANHKQYRRQRNLQPGHVALLLVIHVAAYRSIYLKDFIPDSKL